MLAALIGLHGEAVNTEIVIIVFYFSPPFLLFPVLRWTGASRDGMGGGEGFMCSEMVEKCACVYLRLRLRLALCQG